MKKTNLKIFFKTIFILIIFLSFFSVFFQKVSAQNNNDIIVETMGYSVVSANNFIFNGFYSNNFDKKPFITYFEYEKYTANSQSLKISSGDLFDSFSKSDSLKETIKIVRDKNVSESNYFYSSPELELAADYYFRAVGCFKDESKDECASDSLKYYGNISSIRTGYIPGGYSYPFSMEVDEGGVIKYGTRVLLPKPYKDPVCAQNEKLVDGECVEVLDAFTCGPKQELLNGECIDVLDGVNVNTGKTVVDKASGNLIPCTNNCGFAELLTLIGNIVNFIIYKLALPIAAIMFAYAGFELMVSGGNSEKKSKAIKIFTNVAAGLIFIVGAFVIVKAILFIVGYQTGIGINWFGF